MRVDACVGARTTLRQLVRLGRRRMQTQMANSAPKTLSNSHPTGVNNNYLSTKCSTDSNNDDDEDEHSVACKLVLFFIMEAVSQDEDLPNESNSNFTDELTLPAVVIEQLKNIAETGDVSVDWPNLQRALKLRLRNVLDEFSERDRDCKDDQFIERNRDCKDDQFSERNRDCKDDQFQEPNVEKFSLERSREDVLELIASFNEPPFTIQRICELLHSPFNYYDRSCTFLRGLEKNLRVISSNNWPKSQAPDATV